MVSARRRPGPFRSLRPGPSPAPPRHFRFRLPPGGAASGGGSAMAAGRCPPTLLLLGAAGGGKSLLVRRLRHIQRETQLSAEEPAELGEPPATLPTVGTNLTDLRLPRKVTVRELGGCMGPIWPSYYSECSALLFVVDASNPTQVSSSCIQLLSVLSAAPLASVPVLVLFNKIDLPCYMSLVEMKSLFRMQDIVSCATQPITMLETSARDGTGLAEVLQWLRTTLKDPC
ncbi:PREDICTED: ADP-ribosylation factor-like protein 16 [Sturnus vulgaris]|uniref:ADP-ribosylation factor-like protein 16 n=1 Tax=Sturnus vulgaris TaxID=9172 RepID=UPI00071A65A5|nr:PREDICTED: ADP-ribosylation factor-like protein 16 [Sturnus vulgaris]